MDNWIQSVLAAAEAMSWLEFTAVIFAMAYLLLAVRENVLCWFFALLSTAIYTVLFWDVSLLMLSFKQMRFQKLLQEFKLENQPTKLFGKT